MGHSLAGDCLRIWRQPDEVFGRRLAGASEARAFGLLLAACFVVFVSQLPRLAREAHLMNDASGGEGSALRMLVGINLVAMLLVAPLVLLGVSWLSGLVLRLSGRRIAPLAARMALGWALLASAPLMLAQGIVSGLAGPGAAVAMIGVAVLATFLWLWLRLLREGVKR